jgi:hypothetical protein
MDALRYLPWLQSSQVFSAEDAPSVLPFLPGGHSMQVLLDEALVADEDFPASQSLHAAVDTAASASLHFPEAQALQLDCFLSSVYNPS